MTSEQAIEIREHLINELEKNGFGDVVRELTARLEENIEDVEFRESPQRLLAFFFSESIDVLEALSNDHYEKLIYRFNEFLGVESNKVESISVELINQETRNLRQLPSYQEIISEFIKIGNEIANDTRRDNLR